jgi:hypothetical protein
MLLVMGLGPRFHVFSSYGLPIVRSALGGVVFCLDFGPFCFLLLFPCRMFFLPLFIYLTPICISLEINASLAIEIF